MSFLLFRYNVNYFSFSILTLFLVYSERSLVFWFAFRVHEKATYNVVRTNYAKTPSLFQMKITLQTKMIRAFHMTWISRREAMKLMK